MTARGQFLKRLVDEQAGRISVRKLAAELATRDDFPNDPEDIRRALQRYMTDSNNDRDVGAKYVTAISDVLGLDPAEWPPPKSRPSLASLERRLDEFERQLEDLRRAGEAPSEAP